MHIMHSMHTVCAYILSLSIYIISSVRLVVCIKAYY